MARVPRPEVDEAALRDEARLVAGLAANDPQWIERFVRGSHRAVYACAARFTRDAATRREWTHETMVRLLADVREGRFVFRHPGAFWSWFRKRAYFLTVDQFRRARRRESRLEPDADLESSPDLSPFGAGDPERELARVSLLADIESCLAGLGNSEHRRALRMLLLDELHYDEIAWAMAAPLTSIKTWIRRGRMALRECLTRRWGLEPGPGGRATSGRGGPVFPM